MRKNILVHPFLSGDGTRLEWLARVVHSVASLAHGYKIGHNGNSAGHLHAQQRLKRLRRAGLRKHPGAAGSVRASSRQTNSAPACVPTVVSAEKLLTIAKIADEEFDGDLCAALKPPHYLVLLLLQCPEDGRQQYTLDLIST